MPQQLILVITLVFFCAVSLYAKEPVKILELSTKALEVKVTPDVGGRLIYFGLKNDNGGLKNDSGGLKNDSGGLKNHSNFLRVHTNVDTNPHPDINTHSPHLSYLGLDVWLGPQSEWWIHQELSPARKKAKAQWPPDPFLVLSSHKIIKQSKEEVRVISDPSPVSGMSVTKSFQVNPQEENSLAISVTAKNERTENVAWDIWFNARVNSTAHVYVPIVDSASVRTKSVELVVRHAPPIYKIQNGFLQLRSSPPPAGTVGRQGKIMMQPSEGWMAAFHDHQVFIIQFELQPVNLIHPEQGQVELFQSDEPDSFENSMMEMEVHAPYKKLAPQESMSANQKWILLEYTGDDSVESEMKFLNQLRAKLKL